MDKLQKRYNDLKNGASGASGSAGLLKKLPLKQRIKLLEKRIKNRVLKRVRVLEQMQHKELIKQITFRQWIISWCTPCFISLFYR